ncbi:MAG: hypothetical protein QXL78_00770 [Methanocellales archaeon]
MEIEFKLWKEADESIKQKTASYGNKCRGVMGSITDTDRGTIEIYLDNIAGYIKQLSKGEFEMSFLPFIIELVLVHEICHLYSQVDDESKVWFITDAIRRARIL